MQHLLLVGIGGFVGAISRFLLVMMLPSTSFPVGILAVNVLGSFLIGIVFEHCRLYPYLNSFLIVGLLGGFTTFSAFSAEAINLLNSNQVVYAMLYVLLMTFACLLSTFLGMILI